MIELMEDYEVAEQFLTYIELETSKIFGFPNDWIFTRIKTKDYTIRRSILFNILTKDFKVSPTKLKYLIGYSRVTITDKKIYEKYIIYPKIKSFREILSEIIKLCLIYWEEKKMASFNQITLIGNVGRDPEIITFENGNSIAKFSLAVADPYMNSKGEWVDNTDWFNIVVQGKRVEAVQTKVTKGMLLMVNGKVKQRKYVDKDGHDRISTEVNAYKVVIIPKSSSTNEYSQIDPSEDVGAPPYGGGDDVPF
jgi:single-strand DNA-binding protein